MSSIGIAATVVSGSDKRAPKTVAVLSLLCGYGHERALVIVTLVRSLGSGEVDTGQLHAQTAQHCDRAKKGNMMRSWF
jgi:hypothetical protein